MQKKITTIEARNFKIVNNLDKADRTIDLIKNEAKFGKTNSFEFGKLMPLHWAF